MNAVNKDLLVEVMAQIEMHPETWYQEFWLCDTSACFAGWAVKLACPNAEPVWTDRHVYRDGKWKRRAHQVCTDTGTVASVAELAMRKLGLDRNRAMLLFDACNTMDDLRLIVKALLNDDFDYTTIRRQLSWSDR